ncbi:Aste57867_6508 [Aphanomyces stellatus]|uniref:Aste57867_6508 protein n=1 Tax=Aphanomyces stellatus TaxID=120398 RepID=A0A485KGJ6_9STRA|nr:hypothetical protein As57867_006491 [Aphanomyces stellatus]VFT83492.1 Aste57867_6508 [Aphanomyces stellatus]
MQRLQQQVLGKVKLLAGAADGLPASATKAAQVIFVPKAADTKEALKQALPFTVSTHVLDDFHANAKETLMLYPDQHPRTLLVGLGDSVDEVSLRDATHEALAQLTGRGVRQAYLQAPAVDAVPAQRVAELLAQTSVLSNYQFNRHVTPKDDAKLPLTDIFVQASADFEAVGSFVVHSINFFLQSVAEKLLVADETIFARNLGNERSDIVDPAFMEEIARQSAAALPGLSVRVLQNEDLIAEGLHMMALVGQAATTPPRLVILEYNGNPAAPTERIALVGKGITFDTGGLNLKPTGFIEDMHTDMCGSAAVLGAIRAAAKTGLACNVVAVLALAENAIGSKAAKPHTIVKSLKGLTVEVNNTDAEGRLVLGDALSYVQQQYKPHTVIDVATLTGACIVALGEYCAGVFSNSDDLAHALVVWSLVICLSSDCNMSLE